MYEDKEECSTGTSNKWLFFSTLFPRACNGGIMLTSFLRHLCTFSNSCGANAHTFPRDPLKGSFQFSPPPHIFLHEICAISPELGNPDTRWGHVRLEARRMELPALASCRACATAWFTHARHRVSGARQLSSPSRVHSPKHSSADLLGGGTKKGRIA